MIVSIIYASILEQLVPSYLGVDKIGSRDVFSALATPFSPFAILPTIPSPAGWV